MTLVYEAIMAGVLDYDYAPECTLIGKRRVWANVSQDATNYIDDLIMGKLLRELRMFTTGMVPVRSLQVSALGMEAIRAAPNIMHRKVETFAYRDDELVQARWVVLPDDEESSDSGSDDGGGGDGGDAADGEAGD
eukprot:SAG22_NODE_9033_length_613_cov_2.177043_1_plen_134_part_10